MSQQEVAEATGLALKTIGNIERGDTAPQHEAFEKIMQALGLSIEEGPRGEISRFLNAAEVVLRQLPNDSLELVTHQALALMQATLDHEKERAGNNELKVTHSTPVRPAGSPGQLGDVPLDQDVNQ